MLSDMSCLLCYGMFSGIHTPHSLTWFCFVNWFTFNPSLLHFENYEKSWIFATIAVTMWLSVCLCVCVCVCLSC